VRVEVLLELRVERRWRSARKLMKRRGRAAEVLDEVLLEVRLLVERRWRTARKSVKLLSCREVRRVDVEGARREAEAQRSTRLLNLLFV
jgi:hypothetical protein